MEPTTAYLRGPLYMSQSGWLLMAVPNGIGHAAFSALDEPGIEMPTSGTTGRYNAHVSVMRPEEIAKIGGPERITERGKRVAYTLGRVREVVPSGWDEMAKCWFIEVHSPELSQIRRSYGLSSLPNNDRYRFHITFAVRRKGVLLRNGIVKQAEYNDCPVCGEFYEKGCRCRLGDRVCPNGHEWYHCPVHKDVVLSGSGHDSGLPADACHCNASTKLAAASALPTSQDPILQDLLRAKAYSDRKQYAQKHALLRALIQRYPSQFVVDQPAAAFPGITHTPTRFRVHAPPDVAALVGMSKAATDLWQAAADLAIPKDVQPQLVRGFQTEPVVSGPLSSVLTYPQRGLTRGLRYHREADAQRRWRNATDPAAAAAEFQQALDGAAGGPNGVAT